MYAIPLEEARLHREEKIEKAQRLLTEAVERLQSGEDWQAMLAPSPNDRSLWVQDLSHQEHTWI
jgi:hypothetical protein